MNATHHRWRLEVWAVCDDGSRGAGNVQRQPGRIYRHDRGDPTARFYFVLLGHAHRAARGQRGMGVRATADHGDGDAHALV